ncbi:hypothetical protein SAMN05443550_11159 [Pedobacter hartonius]|uniref:Uncharacterized protein n=2 Tax=Pedobacter hartonius TaxID=425514 RepID=A0A1H4GUQ4_9SPHI|nr:hypothetical protein SAMN05443550_11159 [Pedobacter hartonius]
MNQEDIFKKIGQILNELNDQYQYLAQNPEELNELELELFLANASFLTDHVQIVRKLNKKATQKALPEHAGIQEETIEQEPVIPVKIVEEPAAPASHAETTPVKQAIDDDIFTLDKEPSTFEFILNEKPSSDRFEFEEKSVDEIFDRPLSKEEEQIIAQKQKLRELDSLESELPEEDEIGPEPFLVSEPLAATAYPVPLTEPEPVEEPDFLKDKLSEEQEPENLPFDQEEEVVPDEEEESTEASAEEEVPAQAEDIKPVAEPAARMELFTLPQSAAETPAAPPIAAAAPVIEETASEGQPKVRPTLNDILSGSSNTKNFNTGTSRVAVTDLKQAISLNDKMRYIKDLFNGYNLAYAEAIDLLNKMPDFKTADTFLQNNYAVKNNWASKQDTADQFYELLNQRFPAK